MILFYFFIFFRANHHKASSMYKMLKRKRFQERRNKIEVAISPAICRPVVTIGRGSWKLNYERSQEKLVFVGRWVDTIDKGVRSVSTKCKAHGIGRLDSVEQ